MPSRAAAGGAKGVAGAKGAAGARGTPIPAQFPVKPEVPRYDLPRFKGKLDEVNDLALEIVDLQKERAGIDEQIRNKAAVVQALMEEVDDSKSWSACSDEWTSTYYAPGKSKKIIAELLIQQGVSMDKIKKATRETARRAYVQVKARTAGAGEGEEDE